MQAKLKTVDIVLERSYTSIELNDKGNTMTNSLDVKALFGDIFDDAVTKKDPKRIEFDYDPLAFVCAMVRSNFQPFEIISFLQYPGNELTPQDNIEQQDKDRADIIRSYFSKKHMLRRIKGEFVSKWMHKVDCLCEKPTTIDKDLLTVVVTLPRIFEHNLFTDELAKEYTTVPDKAKPFVLEPVEFVTKKLRQTRNGSNFEYYWRNSNKQLLRQRVSAGDPSNQAWDFIAKQGRVRMSCLHPAVAKLEGYNFQLFNLSADTEIEPYD